MTTNPVDWGKVLHDTEEGTKVIPAGQYPIRVTDASAAVAGTGAQMIKTTVQLQGGPYSGRPIQTNIVFSFDNPRAMRMVFRRLAALGISAEWLAETNATVGQIAAAIIGRECIADVSIRKWNNEDQNDIAMFLTSGGATPDGPGVPAPSGSMVPDLTTLEPDVPDESAGEAAGDLFTMPGADAE